MPTEEQLEHELGEALNANVRLKAILRRLIASECMAATPDDPDNPGVAVTCYVDDQGAYTSPEFETEAQAIEWLIGALETDYVKVRR